MGTFSTISRRELLERALLTGSVALVAGGIRVGTASAQKASKEAMKYQDKPDGDKHCGNCAQFAPPDGCKVVDGKISPQGYCIAWVKK